LCASDWSRRVAKCRVGIEAVAPQELHSAAMKVTGAWGADSSMDAASGSRVDRHRGPVGSQRKSRAAAWEAELK